MARKEDLLQKYLDMLEKGMPFKGVLDQVSREDPQLRQWLILAVRMRSLPPPPIDPAVAREQDAIIQALIQSRAGSQKRPLSGSVNRWWIQTRHSLAGAGVGLFVLLIAIWIIFSVNTLRGAEQSLTVIQINGQAEVRNESGPEQWVNLQAGATITAGQRLRTGPHSSVVLRFSDDSQLTLAHNTEVIVNTLSQVGEDALDVQLTQHSGSTRHQVTPRQNPEAVYVVHTPTSDTYVHGTTFSVSVAQSGSAIIAVQEGKVSVVAGSEEVPLTAGFATYTQAGQIPASPVYAFSSHGELRRAFGTIWEIDEVMVYVSDETILDQGLKAGDSVLVTGRILPNGRWLADTVELIENIEHLVSFTGVLKATARDLWLVDDISLLVTEDTELLSNMAQGDLVQVTYTNLSNGRRLALRINNLSQTSLVDSSLQVITPQIPARPSLSFEPDELEAAGCDVQFSFTANLENSGTSPEDLAEQVELGFTVLAGDQYVEDLAITPSMWEEIPAGETVPFSVQVNLSPDWLAARPETEVKLRLYVAAETNRPQQLVARLTIAMIQACAQAVDPPSSSQPVQPPLPTAVTPDDSPLPAGDCTGAQPHPEGLRLADLYQVSYAEIMQWFCQGFGFGEIDLAYSLSRQTGVAVAEIFALRGTGMGWGEIMQQLGVLPAGPPASAPEDDGQSPANPPAGPPAGPPDSANPDVPPINLPVLPAPADGPPSTLPGPP